eukprot:jgi/Phyca11/507476/fgenesh2_kg.PHYCAscaffold_27_\
MTDYSPVSLTGTPLTPRSLSSFGSSHGSEATDSDAEPVEVATEMCVKERERLTTAAKRMTESLLEATDLLGGIPWGLVHEKHGISLFRADTTNSGTNVPCNVHAVCKFACSIEDVAASLITPTTASYKRMMAMLSSDFLDGAVVQNIVEPTPTNPHRYVGLKWATFKSSGTFAKDRDMLMLEYVDMIEDAQGQMTAFRIMESVDAPTGFEQYAESPKFKRDLVPLMGFMYHSTKRPGELRMTYTCNFDNGDLPAFIANSAIQSHVEKCINGILKYTENFRVGREEIVLPQQVVPMSEQDHCKICNKKFCVRRRRYNCLKCGEVCCSSCSSVRSAHVPDIGERQLRVCTACVIEARQSSRNGKDSPNTSTSSLSSTGNNNQFFSDTNEDSPTLGRAKSFSVTKNEPNRSVAPKRRSYDSLLDPVRSRLIEYKTFSSGTEEGHGFDSTGSAIGVPKASFPSRSFSDGLVMRNRALFAAKRRGSPADLAISIEAFRLRQMRMGNAEQQNEDILDENDHTDDESTASSSSVSPTYSITRASPLHRRASPPSLHPGRLRIQVNPEINQESPVGGGEEIFEFNEAMARSKDIIVAANYANSLAQQARKLSHFRVVALQQEHEFMAPMLRDGGDKSNNNHNNNNSPVVRRRPRHRRHGSDFEVAQGAGTVLYSN